MQQSMTHTNFQDIIHHSKMRKTIYGSIHGRHHMQKKEQNTAPRDASRTLFRPYYAVNRHIHIRNLFT